VSKEAAFGRCAAGAVSMIRWTSRSPRAVGLSRKRVLALASGHRSRGQQCVRHSDTDSRASDWIMLQYCRKMDEQ